MELSFFSIADQLHIFRLVFRKRRLSIELK